MSENFDVAFRRIQQSQQHFDRRGFAGAVRPEQTEHLAAADLEIDIVDRARFGRPQKSLKILVSPRTDNDHSRRRLAASVLADCLIRLIVISM